MAQGTPLLHARMTSELGAVTPWIVVPALFSASLSRVSVPEARCGTFPAFALCAEHRQPGLGFYLSRLASRHDVRVV